MDTMPIQVYYGNGAGKTSAALGNAIRCASNGGSVYIVQFLKGQTDSEYMKKLEPEIKVFRFERSTECFDDLSPDQIEDEKQNIRNGLNFAKKALATGQCDMLVLDEVLGVIGEGVCSEEDILTLLGAKSPFTTVILTGRNLPESIRSRADQVYNINTEKPSL